MTDLGPLIRQLQGRTDWKFAEVAANETTTSVTYAALATAGPSITLDAGRYIIGIGAGARNSASGQESWMSFDIGSTGAVDADNVKYTPDAATNKQVSVARLMLKTITADGTTLTAKYRVGGGTGGWDNRWILAIPFPA